MSALIGAKLFHVIIPRSIDDLLNRKRRSIDEVEETPLDQAKLDGLTAVVMAALDSQQWYVKIQSLFDKAFCDIVYSIFYIVNRE